VTGWWQTEETNRCPYREQKPYRRGRGRHFRTALTQLAEKSASSDFSYEKAGKPTISIVLIKRIIYILIETGQE
jgi:hypothetical protein